MLRKILKLLGLQSRGNTPCVVPQKMDFEDARRFAITHLAADAQSHEQGEFEQIGGGYQHFDSALPRDLDGFEQLFIVLNFWDLWIDERNHYFVGHCKVSQEAWPALARSIVADLSAGRPISNPTVLAIAD